jgi:3-oxoadipate enol-lactonase
VTPGNIVELHHLLEGPEDAPVVVMANSLGTTLRMWDDQAPKLSSSFRLLRYDHRGHGGSPVPPGPYKIEDLGGDVLALLDRLGIERASFCGLSLGGMVGMWLASEAPERLERLVVCCTSVRFAAEVYDARAQTVLTEGVEAIADRVLERWFTPGFRANHHQTIEWASRMLRNTSAEGYAGCCEAIRDADLRSRLDEIQAPTLVIAGADDLAAPVDQAELISGSVAGARLVVIPHAAHLANIEQPEAVTGAVLKHLDPVGGRTEGR